MRAKDTDAPLKLRSVKLREEQDEWLTELAWKQRRSVSELLREVVDCYMQRPPAKKRDSTSA